MVTRSVKFNLGGFIEDLDNVLKVEDLDESLENDSEQIDDIIQRYKDFLSRTKEPLLSSVKSYVERHYLVVANPRIQSFINACYR